MWPPISQREKQYWMREKWRLRYLLLYIWTFCLGARRILNAHAKLWRTWKRLPLYFIFVTGFIKDVEQQWILMRSSLKCFCASSKHLGGSSLLPNGPKKFGNHNVGFGEIIVISEINTCHFGKTVRLQCFGYKLQCIRATTEWKEKNEDRKQSLNYGCNATEYQNMNQAGGCEKKKKNREHEQT